MSDPISRHFAGLVRSEDVPWIVVGDVAPLRELFIGGDLHLTDDVKGLYDRLLWNARAPASNPRAGSATDRSVDIERSVPPRAAWLL